MSATSSSSISSSRQDFYSKSSSDKTVFHAANNNELKLPASLTNQQVAEAVVDYILDHPLPTLPAGSKERDEVLPSFDVDFKGFQLVDDQTTSDSDQMLKIDDKMTDEQVAIEAVNYMFDNPRPSLLDIFALSTLDKENLERKSCRTRIDEKSDDETINEEKIEDAKEAVEFKEKPLKKERQFKKRDINKSKLHFLDSKIKYWLRNISLKSGHIKTQKYEKDLTYRYRHISKRSKHFKDLRSKKLDKKIFIGSSPVIFKPLFTTDEE